MNCKNAQSLLSAYLDEELAGREMLDIRDHLSACSVCSEELRCIEGVKRVIGGSPIPEPSADFEDRLVQHVLSVTAAPAQKKISLITLTGIAAASMLATMLLLNTMRRDSPAVAESRDNMPFELMQRNRAFEASESPLTGSPVMLSRR